MIRQKTGLVIDPYFSSTKIQWLLKNVSPRKDDICIGTIDAYMLWRLSSGRAFFTDVSNALIAHQRVQEARVKQEGLVAVLEVRKRLAYMRYQGGVDTQLNALDSDRDLLQAKLDLRQIRLNELLSVVQLYKALGGGWQS